MTSPRTRSIASGRLKLHITEWGPPDAPPLILQHGGKDHGRSWDAVALAFAGAYRVIVPDLRGHGDSDWASDGAYDLTDYVLDFTTVVDTLAPGPCPLIGHSLGGNIVTRFAGLYPGRVTKIVNIEGLGYSPALQAEVDARDPVEVLRGWIETRMQSASRVPRRYPDLATMIDLITKTDERLTPELAAHLATHATVRNADGSYSFKYDPALKGPAPIDISTAARHQLWRAITCPVLLVYGRQSWASNPAEDGRAAIFRNARVELFDDAGHWVHHDRQADFITMALDFLAS